MPLLAAKSTHRLLELACRCQMLATATPVALPYIGVPRNVQCGRVLHVIISCYVAFNIAQAVEAAEQGTKDLKTVREPEHPVVGMVSTDKTVNV